MGCRRSAEVSPRPAETRTPRSLPREERGGENPNSRFPNGANIAIPSAITTATRSSASTRRPRRSGTASSIFPTPPLCCPITSPNSCCFRTPATTTRSILDRAGAGLGQAAPGGPRNDRMLAPAGARGGGIAHPRSRRPIGDLVKCHRNRNSPLTRPPDYLGNPKYYECNVVPEG